MPKRAGVYSVRAVDAALVSHAPQCTLAKVDLPAPIRPEIPMNTFSILADAKSWEVLAVKAILKSLRRRMIDGNGREGGEVGRLRGVGARCVFEFILLYR